MANKTKKKGPTGTPPVYDKQKMFDFFLASVAKLRRDWDALANLFMDAKRRAYLTKNVPVLGDCISTLLTVSVYMEIAQLFDPLMTFNDHRKSNLVLRRVIDDMAPPVGTAERTQIEADYMAMESTVKLIKEWRNVMGAHRNLITTIRLTDYVRSGHKQPHPLPHIPLMDVHHILECLVNITDAIVDHAGVASSSYDFAVVREVDLIFAGIGLT